MKRFKNISLCVRIAVAERLLGRCRRDRRCGRTDKNTLSSGDGVNIWLIVVLIAVFAIGAFIGYRNRNKY